jgi:inosine-uridine nucleoside N-ribohydrolase
MYGSRRFNFLLILLFALNLNQVSAGCGPTDSPVRVIFDTDLDSDVDDVGALAMLLNLHQAGTIDLIGVVVTSDDPYAPVCAAAINTFYGFPDIPVGFLKGQPKLNNHSRYTRQISHEFPSGISSWEQAEDAVELYRRLLAGSPDESVYVVTVGHLSSLQRLMQSGPDDASQLDGPSLVREKVKQWLCMGGQYPAGKEANFYRPDPASTVYCVENWEKDVIFCGWEAGNPVLTGGEWLKETLAPGHPVYRGYELYNGFAGRQSWDQLAVLLLLEEGRSFFDYTEGTCVVASDGSNTWVNSSPGKHRYISIKPSVGAESISRYIDRLMAGKQ